MSDEVRDFLNGVVSLLTKWIFPLSIALFGMGLYALSGKYSGEQRIALQATAFVMWVNSWIFNLRGYAMTVLLANEAAALRGWPKPEPKELPRFAVQVNAVRWVYPDFPDWEPKWVEALAWGVLARRPFTEREYKTKIPVQRFRDMQDDWLKNGMAEPNRKGRGAHPTEGGVKWARKIVTKRRLPSPIGALSLQKQPN